MGFFFIWVDKDVNGGYIIDLYFLYLVVFIVYFFYRNVGSFVMIGFIKVGGLKCLNSYWGWCFIKDIFKMMLLFIVLYVR